MTDVDEWDEPWLPAGATDDVTPATPGTSDRSGPEHPAAGEPPERPVSVTGTPVRTDRSDPAVGADVAAGLDSIIGPAKLPEHRTGDTWNIGPDGAVHYAVHGGAWACRAGRDGAPIGDAWPTGPRPLGVCPACIGDDTNDGGDRARP